MRRVDGAALFSPYGVLSARVRAMRYVPKVDGSASDATASTSICPLNIYARARNVDSKTVNFQPTRRNIKRPILNG